MSSTQISWVLAAQSPGSLVRFYADLLGGHAEQGHSEHHWVLTVLQDLRIEIYRPSRQRPFPVKGRCLAPCLRLQEHAEPLKKLQSVVAELMTKQATVLEPPRLESFGAEAWLLDPEQNPFLIVVPTSVFSSDVHGF